MENNLELDFRNLKIHHICYIYQEPEKHAKMISVHGFCECFWSGNWIDGNSEKKEKELNTVW